MTAFNSQWTYQKLAVVSTFRRRHRTLSFHVVVFRRTAQKCTKIYNARSQLLFRSLNLLCSDVLVAVVVVVCLNSQMLKVITSNSASNLICHGSTVYNDSSTTTISMSGSTCSDVEKFYSFSDRRRSNDEQMN